MTKNSRVNKIVILTIIGLILGISLVIFILNYTKDSSSLSIIEKSWINNHSSSTVDVSVYNDVPIYGKNGEGIIFSYLEEFTNSYGINFNKISYLHSSDSNLENVSFQILDASSELSDNDIEIYQDNYVIVSKENIVFDRVTDITGIKLGIIEGDESLVKYYLNDNTDNVYVSCADIDDMFTKLDEGDIDYLVIPKIRYLDEIISNGLVINYHFNNLYNRYVIRVEGDNTLKSILKKYYMIYEENYLDTRRQEYLIDTLFEELEISEAEQMSYNGSVYTYGYVINMPYENTINKEFVGTVSYYLRGFEEYAAVDFKIVGYNSYQELKEAFSNGEVDMIFANFSLDGVKVDVLDTISPFEEEYVVLSKDKFVVGSIRELKEYSIYAVGDTYLANYLKSNGIDVITYNNTDDLLLHIKYDSMVILDKDTYTYYRNSKFKDFYIVYEDSLSDDYRFVIRDVNKNSTFYKLFSYYVSDISYNEIKYMYNTDFVLRGNNYQILKIMGIILGVIIILGIIGIIIYKHRNKNKELNRVDKLKLIDVMTSLKNRNYLNYNIKKWDELRVYPQAIVIIDLNNIKYINDNYGHAEGDEVIKRAASILIANQKEKTDIIRTDGNEFLVYMIGYDKKQVIEYTRKISKCMKELPHGFGATFGFSMIEDDVKTIDDAINEATLLMRQAKEKL